ncbi:hypothetical protein [Allorhodopirellula heiligendammensis]|uniref:Uncharacterized protein n=1 Tax=Allorhodopirellula heiligendammensis TaxID=2714739 RepID=A0A5C6C4Z4_9BACT|nr:hypothetical protein [Allorhodopirellula heiligendammensis]TWU18404.1 hypothetical protein Poly21_05660 [Allorhodopirellula heiligendammensis]
MKTRIGLALLLTAALAAFCLLTPRVSAGGAAADRERIHPRTYRVADLAVWSKDGQFQPKMMMSFIQASVEPKGWEAKGGQSTMAPYVQNASLVIATTAETHDKIAKFLEQYR